MNVNSNLYLKTFQDGLKYFSGGIVSHCIEIELSEKFEYHPVFPEFAYKQAAFIRDLAQKVVKKSECTRIPVPIRWCLVQTLFVDVLLQEIFLRQMPKAIIRLTIPSYEPLVDHSIAKIARAIIAYLGHALPSIAAYEGSKKSDMPIGSLIAGFITRLVTGLIRENQENRTLDIVSSMGLYGSAFLFMEDLISIRRLWIENGKESPVFKTSKEDFGIIKSGVDEACKSLKIPFPRDLLDGPPETLKEFFGVVDEYQKIRDGVRKIKEQESKRSFKFRFLDPIMRTMRRDLGDR